MMTKLKTGLAAWVGMAMAAFASAAGATTITIAAADFIETPVKSNVRTYLFAIEVTGPLAPGGVYTNPALDGVDYFVRGGLVPGTPSEFSSFNLIRAIGGAEFYSQGSSLSFSILPTAKLHDGLQLNELAGSGVVFELNAREVNTGRYHPPILQLRAGGTGLLQNSNNFGGTNPATGSVVNVNAGDEYITNLTFIPAEVTIAPPVRRLRHGCCLERVLRGSPHCAAARVKGLPGTRPPQH